MTNAIADIEQSDCLLVTGSNTTETHPIIGSKFIAAKRNGAKLIVIDPRRIPLSKHADLFLQIKPGTNIALFNGFAHVILKENRQDSAYIEAFTEGFEVLKKAVEIYTPKYVSSVTGIPETLIVQAARMYADAEKAGIYYTMGITQHQSGTENVMSLSNLALLCGNIGIVGGGINPLRGQNNVQGSCDMGALPNVLPGYQRIEDSSVRQKFEKHWGVDVLPANVGLTIPEMIDGILTDSVRLLYIMGENPMVSDPDTRHIEHALDHLDFLVVQDIFLTETALKAHVVLPAACFAEKDGTFTNTERLIQRVRKAVEPPGKAKSDSTILAELARLMGYDQQAQTGKAIMEELVGVTPQYGGITYDRIEVRGLHWPCPTTEHPGTPLLHKGGMARGLGKFMAVSHRGPQEVTDSEYPYMLTTGRVLYHYHTRSMTGKVDGLNALSGESFVEISPELAVNLGISHGDGVQVKSRRGTVDVVACVTKRVSGHTLFMPFHFAEGAANYLTNSALDPISKTPELKLCAVSLTKLV
jgi:formate dehydrogenase major subunit